MSDTKAVVLCDVRELYYGNWLTDVHYNVNGAVRNNLYHPIKRLVADRVRFEIKESVKDIIFPERLLS